MSQNQSDQFQCSKWDPFLCVFFILFWIVPLIYTNVSLKKIPFFPKFIAAISSTSNLFTHANYIWPVPYIQVLPAGELSWITLREEDYFRLQTFGHRTRFYEALYLAVDDAQKSLGVQKELAQWVAQRYHASGGRPVRAVRFVAGLNRAKPGNTFDGHWKTPPYDSFAPQDTYELSRHTMTQSGN